MITVLIQFHSLLEKQILVVIELEKKIAIHVVFVILNSTDNSTLESEQRKTNSTDNSMLESEQRKTKY